MDDNQSTSVTAEGGDAFADTEKQTDTAPASSPETKPTDTTQAAPEAKQKATEPLPWHKDPRWQEWQTEKATLTKQVEDLLPLKDLASKFSAQDTPKIPSWFSRIYGEDQNAWSEYNTWNKSQRDEIKAEVLKEYESKQKAQSDAVANANKHFEDAVTELSQDGTPVDRNKLLKFVQDNDLVDSQGRWNYKSGFKFMRDLERATLDAQKDPITDAKKQIADTSTSGSKERKTKNYMTPSDFKGKSMFSLK